MKSLLSVSVIFALYTVLCAVCNCHLSQSSISQPVSCSLGCPAPITGAQGSGDTRWYRSRVHGTVSKGHRGSGDTRVYRGRTHGTVSHELSQPQHFNTQVLTFLILLIHTYKSMHKLCCNCGLRRYQEFESSHLVTDYKHNLSLLN